MNTNDIHEKMKSILHSANIQYQGNQIPIAWPNVQMEEGIRPRILLSLGRAENVSESLDGGEDYTERGMYVAMVVVAPNSGEKTARRIADDIRQAYVLGTVYDLPNGGKLQIFRSPTIGAGYTHMEKDKIVEYRIPVVLHYMATGTP